MKRRTMRYMDISKGEVRSPKSRVRVPKVRLYLVTAAIVLGTWLAVAATAQASPIGGPLGDARWALRILNEEFAGLVDLLNELNVKLYDEQDADGDGDKGLFDVIEEALNLLDTGADAWTLIQAIEDAVELHKKIDAASFSEIHALLAELDEDVGGFQGRIEALLESRKIRTDRANKILRKLDVISHNVHIIQIAFQKLEAKMEDGDAGEEDCDVGSLPENCFDDVTDFLFLALDTLSANLDGFDAGLVTAILVAGQEMVLTIVREKDRLFSNLRDISRAIKVIEAELRRAQSDLKKGKLGPFTGALAMGPPGEFARVQVYDLAGRIVLDDGRDLSALARSPELRANGVYLSVLTHFNARGLIVGRRVEKFVMRR